MISMSVIHSIRSMRKEGCSIAAIARELHVSEPTVRKYLKAADLSPKPPVTRSRPSKIDPWVPLIEQWLVEDRESWSKQRHTATRIHERLVREHGADVSLSTVTRKVDELKGRFRLERERGFLDLSWHEGEAQADFGQTDVWWRGARRRMHYFVLSFPYSNTAVACLTPGENAECACAALRWLFERLGGVPRRIVFDNAAGVGRKRKDGSVRYTGLFAGFRAHYGFDSTLCNRIRVMRRATCSPRSARSGAPCSCRCPRRTATSRSTPTCSSGAWRWPTSRTTARASGSRVCSSTTARRCCHCRTQASTR